MTVVANYSDDETLPLPQEMQVLASSDGTIEPDTTVAAIPPACTLWLC